jgi:hypothetical protein
MSWFFLGVAIVNPYQSSWKILSLSDKIITKGKDDLSSSLHSAILAPFDTINRQRGDACLPSQLRFAHQEFFPNLSDNVLRQFFLHILGFGSTPASMLT